jgi:hypothetical protein
VYEADLTRLDEALMSEKKRKTISQSSTYPKAPKGYAIRHGVLRGSFDGLGDENILEEHVPLDMKSLDEGLYTLVQTGLCRRKVLTLIYGNDTPRKSIVIMEICTITHLFDRSNCSLLRSV